jgi:hypothetical protein
MNILPDQTIVPVLTFHSVGMQHDSWVWSHLSERADVFECLLRRLREAGYRTVGLRDLYSHMSGEQICPPKSIVVVFDDGYLDNWVSVAPILRKYDMRGVVYVNPDFVDPGEEARPTIEDGSAEIPDTRRPDQIGFMNWKELEIADREGVLDVQSHSQTHTWYFSGSRIVDYYSPFNAPKYPWMAWNARPDRKPFYLQEDQTEFVSWANPVFEFEKSLLVRRFFPDEDLIQDLIETAHRKYGRRLFEDSGLMSDFLELAAGITGGGDFPGRIESDDEYQERVTWELSRSKQIIETRLNKQVEFLCWPGGGVNDVCKATAAEVGYKAWTLPSSELPKKRNQPGENPREIRRLSAMRDVFLLGRRWGRGGELLLFLDILAHQHSAAFNLLRRLYKVGVAFGIAGEK